MALQSKISRRISSSFNSFVEEAVALLPQIFAIISRDDQYQCKDLELTVPQLRMLHTLYQHGEMNMKQLSELLHVSPPSATMTADRLVDLRLISRKDDPRDRRGVQVYLTSKGGAMMDKFVESKKGRWQKIMSSLNERDREGLIKTLRGLLALLQKAEITEGKTGL